jgi:hypothetical protein
MNQVEKKQALFITQQVKYVSSSVVIYKVSVGIIQINYLFKNTCMRMIAVRDVKKISLLLVSIYLLLSSSVFA